MSNPEHNEPEETADEPSVPEAPTDSIFWFKPGGGAIYLIPKDVDLPAGELELMTLRGERRRVDAEAVARWHTDMDTAKSHLKGQLYAGLDRLGVGLREAWRAGRNAHRTAGDDTARAESGEGTRTPDAVEAERVIHAVSSSVADSLTELAERLRRVSSEAKVSSEAGEPSDGGEEKHASGDLSRAKSRTNG